MLAFFVVTSPKQPLTCKSIYCHRNLNTILPFYVSPSIFFLLAYTNLRIGDISRLKCLETTDSGYIKITPDPETKNHILSSKNYVIVCKIFCSK